MSEFKREERYIVIKLKDLSKAQKTLLKHGLKANNIPTRECVVIEKHWPIYDDAWKLVEELDHAVRVVKLKSIGKDFPHKVTPR